MKRRQQGQSKKIVFPPHGGKEEQVLVLNSKGVAKWRNPPYPRCPKCNISHKSISMIMNFCPSCGTKLVGNINE